MNILPVQVPGFRAQGSEGAGQAASPASVGLSEPWALGPGPSSCLTCIFPQPPSGPVETCDTAGILSTAVNFAASIQATEALKYLTGNVAQMRRTLLSYDLWSNTHSEISAATPDPGCDVCAHRNFRYLSGIGRPHITLCGRNSVQIHEHARPIDLTALAAKTRPLWELSAPTAFSSASSAHPTPSPSSPTAAPSSRAPPTSPSPAPSTPASSALNFPPGSCHSSTLYRPSAPTLP